MADRKKFTKTLRRSKVRIAPLEHPVFEKKKVTPKTLPKYLQSLLSAVAPQMMREALEVVRNEMDSGSLRAAEVTLRAYGVGLKDSPTIAIQNNVNNNGGDNAPPAHRSIDAFYRQQALKRGVVVDTQAIECQPSSLHSSPQPLAGSKMLESEN